MSNVPLPEPELFYWKPSFVKGESIQIKGYTAEAMHAHAAAVSAAKDKEIAQLRAELIKSLADNAALRADAIDRQNNVVAPLRAEVAGLREDAERYRWLRDKLNMSDQATWNIFMSEGVEQWDAAIDAALAARKGEA